MLQVLEPLGLSRSARSEPVAILRAGLLTGISYLMQREEMPRQHAGAYLKQL